MSVELKISQCSYLRKYLLLFCISMLIFVGEGMNPYEILGVKRSDSEKLIKAAYKKLALKLHPDKSKSPTAQDEMMKVNEAYEILSNPEKKIAYDRYGTIDPQHQNKPNYDAFHEFRRGPGSPFSFIFEDFPFGSNYHFHDYQRQNLLTRYNYRNIVLPDSHHKLFLIYVVGEVCFECLQLQSLWNKMSDNLNRIGISVYEMVYERDVKLAREIGINTYPQFVAVIAGRCVRYKAGDYSEHAIRSFLSALLPHYLLSHIVDDHVAYFQKSFDDNKPQCLLFSKHLQPPLLFKAVAYEYHNKVKFAYIDVKDLRTKRLQRKYEINGSAPVIVFLKEEPSSPVAILRGSELKRGVLRTLVSSNLYLFVPRLSSQEIFDNICPTQNIEKHHFCLTLVVESHLGYSSSLWKLRQMAKDEQFVKWKIQFSYVFGDIQKDFVNSFNEGGDLHSIPCSDGKLPYNILIMSRKTDVDVRYSWFTNGWCGTEASVKELESFINDHISGESELSFQVKIPILIDEHYHGWLWGFMRKTYFVVQNVVDAVDSPSWFNFPSLLIFCMILLATLTCVGIPLVTYIINRSSEGNLPQHTPDEINTNVLGLEKLDYRSQKRFIHNSKPGRITVSILVDTSDVSNVASSPIIQAFADVIYRYTSLTNYSFTWLSIAENLLWCTDIMNVKSFGAFLPGTVLAMNGYRKYVYIFKPNINLRDAPNVSSNFLGFESSDDEGDSYEYLERIRSKKAAICIRKDLPTWLERLSEGTLSDKVRIQEWPQMEG